jgi:hydroxyethylthiazole kinase-like uncharacterized protein yjeF
MRALETNSEYFGISLLQLMENAGRNVAIEVASRFKKDQRVVIFCGLGGNGGDGIVAARHLLSMGFSKIAVIVAGKSGDINHEAAKENWAALQPFVESIVIHEVVDAAEVENVEADVVVDALLGTGTKGKLRPPVSKFVAIINSMKAFKVSVDVPTGIDSDTGDVLGEAVKADLTVTFHRGKSGFRAAKAYTGKLVVTDIGLPQELDEFAGPGDVQLVTKARSAFAHKGDSGRVLLVGGSEVFSGAPVLMSMAALRTGVDLAFTASPEKTAHDIASLSPDLICVKLEGSHLNPNNVDSLKDYVRAVDAVVMGPGLGLHEETKQFVEDFVRVVEKAGKPLLLDADGLKAFGEFKRRLKVPLVLTPHAGEYAVLTGKRLPDDVPGRVSYVKETAAELGAVVLLKGAVDIVSDGSKVKLNFTGNAGMTVGGTGDVLSGIVGAFLAQKADAFEAAVAGAFVNGAAGDFVAANVGFHMVATDLLEYIPNVLNDPISHLKVRNGGKGT